MTIVTKRPNKILAESQIKPLLSEFFPRNARLVLCLEIIKVCHIFKTIKDKNLYLSKVLPNLNGRSP